jgi:GntR family transcriptional regulator
MELEKGPIPLYYQLKMVLRNKILSDEFSSSNPFPTEHNLCEEFKVSRSVVRQALMELEKDQFIRREQGRGTFVKHGERHLSQYKMFGSIDEMWILGTKTKLKLHGKTLVTPDSDKAADMNLNKSERVFLFEGIRYFEGGRKAFFEAYVPQDLGENVNLEELVPPYLIHRIEQTSLQTLERARQVIYASAASKKIASVMDVKQRHPLLVIKRIYFSNTNRVLEMAITHIPAEVFKLEAELVRTHS